MRFVKMHGLGNDFVVVAGPVDLDRSAVAAICDRRLGVGADGLLSVTMDGSVTMGYWNADGSEAEMCGNGLRCVARYAAARMSAPGSGFTIDTPAGPRRAELGEGDLVTVELGPVEVGEVVRSHGRELTRVSVGNPHAVTLVDDPETVDVGTEGKAIARDPVFPEGANVEFAAIDAADRVRMRVWERGVGETPACGSGMAAVAAVARQIHGADRVTVSVHGGSGVVEFRDGVAWLTGPAVEVFEGDWPSG